MDAATKGGRQTYRDRSLPISARVSDLLSRMTLPEKAGQLFHTMLPMGPNGTLSEHNSEFGIEGTETLLDRKHMTHFNLIGPVRDAQVAAQWHNRLQERAAQSKLGIPITVSTDPRHHFTENVGASFQAGCFSQWPETLGLAALRSPQLVERFGDIARREYLAVGLRCALHPQIDVATEPRWARINATFGEDAELSGELAAAYLRGFQVVDASGSGGQHSVSCMTKHFPGGGPQKDGEDPHFTYGKDQVYPGENFEYHLKPFYKAIAAGTRQIMPYYGRPVGLELDIKGNGQKEKIEEVGLAFNRQLITGILREKMGFKGIICTDWGLVTDASIMGQNMPAPAWGCESLTPLQRVVKILEAGCDQFGGEACPELVVEAVQTGYISEHRLDESVARVLEEKFWLGLFDDKRFVDVEKATSAVGQDDDMQAGLDAQRRSFTLLKNDQSILPLKLNGKTMVYVEGFDGKLLAARFPRQTVDIVDKPEDAQLAIMRLKAPFEPRPGGFEAFFHAGSLEFTDTEKARQAHILQSVPTIVDLYLDRPAVVSEVSEKAAALVTNYGASVDAFLDVITGQTVEGKPVRPEGKLPFDLPSSMNAVRKSKEDMPFATESPLFKFGHGLSY